MISASELGTWCRQDCTSRILKEYLKLFFEPCYTYLILLFIGRNYWLGLILRFFVINFVDKNFFILADLRIGICRMDINYLGGNYFGNLSVNYSNYDRPNITSDKEKVAPHSIYAFFCHSTFWLLHTLLSKEPPDCSSQDGPSRHHHVADRWAGYITWKYSMKMLSVCWQPHRGCCEPEGKRKHQNLDGI